MRYLALFVLFALVASVFAFGEPAPGEPLQEIARFMDPEELNKVAGNVRSPRLICDTLQLRYRGINVENVLCALRCHKRRRRGGHCQGGTCVCT